ncbi:hypothetical protein WS72_02500 [Burkholderia savannae]|uniref:Uncharacterized protein n=1 Tax=Burkholderia savannae TaxID=1637837 RepID=A0ABR5TAJ7_9BURK|nr:hypothetical protein WS72_02500 [Burkholderia savannae]
MAAARVVKGVSPDERTWVIESASDEFHVTDQYAGWPIVWVRRSAAHLGTVKALLLREWRALVPVKWRDGMVA